MFVHYLWLGAGAAVGCAPMHDAPVPTDEVADSRPAPQPAVDSGDAARDSRPGPWTPQWSRKTLSETYDAEGAAFGDLNRDGVLDLVAGAVWYAGPSWELGGRIADVPLLDFRTSYSAFLLTFVGDVNEDGRDDVLGIGFPGTAALWYENPGDQALDGHWAVHTIHPSAGGESAAYVDLVGGASKELVFIADGTLGYAAPTSDPSMPWTFHAISPPSPLYGTFFHGMGVGDLDGDGLSDVLEPTGWWRQRPGTTGPIWERHLSNFAPRGAQGGGQMLVFDVDGDGDHDVVTSLNAHGYGLSWFEQVAGPSDIEFVEHGILQDGPAPGNFSELHALSLADINGDGLPDVITGRRYYAHDHGDPALADPAVLFWFELARSSSGVSFIPHAIDEDSGVGCVFVTGDVDGDHRPDIFTTNKKGTHLFTQR